MTSPTIFAAHEAQAVDTHAADAGTLMLPCVSSRGSATSSATSYNARQSIVSLVAAICLALTVSDAAGQTTLDWDVNKSGAGTGGTGNWGTAAANDYWTDGTNYYLWNNVPGGPSQAIARFGGTPGTVSLTASFDAYSLVFTTGGYTVNSSSTVNRTVTLTSGVVQTDLGTTVFGERFLIGGTAGLTKQGAGTLILSAVANPYSGATTINDGTLAVAKLSNSSSSSSIGASTQDAANLVINGGTLKYTGTGDTTNRFFTVGGGGATLESSGTGALNFTASGSSSIVFSGSGNRTLTLAGSNTAANTLSGLVADSTGAVTSLTKTGAGSWTVGGSISTYTGVTTVSGGTLVVDNAGTTTGARLSGTSNVTINSNGTLLLSQTGSASTNRINNSATMTLNGGTFNTGGLSERQGTTTVTAGLGALSLQSNSVIDLANGASILAFSSSNGQAWTGTLNIYNYSGTAYSGNGTDQLYFGTSTTGLTGTQLSQIKFYSGSGTGYLGFGGWAADADGEVVPVPEPSTYAAGLLAFAALGFSQRRRIAQVMRRRAAAV